MSPVDARPRAEPGVTPAVDPRIQRRRQEVQEAEARRRRRILVSATIVLGLGVAGWGVLRSPLLAVRHVRVVGAGHTPAGAVVRAAGLARHRQMSDVAGGAMVRAVEGLPWIATARVDQHWPSTVVITVTERHSVAQANDARGWALLDASGRVLEVDPAPATGVVVVAVATSGAGAGAGPGAGGGGPPGPTPPVVAGEPATSAPDGLGPALAVAASLPPALRPAVTAVTASSDGQLTLTLAGGGSAVLGTTDQLSDKLLALTTMLTRVRVGTATVDVRVPTAPVLTTTGPSH
jgi:cell division protein FtsQ